jgi:preprotein translocase subunit SecE
MSNKVRDYIDEVTEELTTKVSWPSWSELQSSAMVVLMATLIVSFVIFAMDWGSSMTMSTFYKLFQK